MKDKIITFCLVIYMLIGVVTFGHCWNKNEFRYNDQQVLASGASAVLWPIYISVKLWEKDEYE
jgi:hypothetical protein